MAGFIGGGADDASAAGSIFVVVRNLQEEKQADAEAEEGAEDAATAPPFEPNRNEYFYFLLSLCSRLPLPGLAPGSSASISRIPTHGLWLWPALAFTTLLSQLEGTYVIFKRVGKANSIGVRGSRFASISRRCQQLLSLVVSLPLYTLVLAMLSLFFFLY